MNIFLVQSDKYKIFRPTWWAYLAFILVFPGFFTHCSSPVDLPEFDEKAWREDARSCRNIRPTLAPALLKNKSKLMGLNHTQILALLGKPEGNSLEKSGEREYYYFVQPGDQCQTQSLPSAASKIFIRFDALDRVYKVRVGDEG